MLAIVENADLLNTANRAVSAAVKTHHEVGVVKKKELSEGFHHMDFQFKPVQCSHQGGVPGQCTQFSPPRLGRRYDAIQQTKPTQFSVDAFGRGLHCAL